MPGHSAARSGAARLIAARRAAGLIAARTRAAPVRLR